MPYPVIPSRRIPYDIDGTAIGYTNEISRSSTDIVAFSTSPSNWFSSTQLANSNGDSFSTLFSMYNTGRAFYVFFPELRELTHFTQKASGDPISYYSFQGSADTTNGMDGTWETPVYTKFDSQTLEQTRSTGLMTVSFSGPVKALRVKIGTGYADSTSLKGWHFYGFKYAGETPDDVIFLDSGTGAELTSLMDWGDRPEGTTMYRQVKLKNSSATKTANNINLQLNHSDFALSWNAGGPWSTVLDITSLGAGAESGIIYIKNELMPPPLTLGPRMDARIIATVGSWT